LNRGTGSGTSVAALRAITTIASRLERHAIMQRKALALLDMSMRANLNELEALRHTAEPHCTIE
jgi:hypothetical protein